MAAVRAHEHVALGVGFPPGPGAAAGGQRLRGRDHLVEVADRAAVARAVPTARPRSDDVHEAHAGPLVVVGVDEVAADGDDPDAPTPHRLPPHPGGERAQLALADRVAAPRAGHLDQQPRRHLRRRRRQRFASVTGGDRALELNQGRPPLRRPDARPRPPPTTRPGRRRGRPGSTARPPSGHGARSRGPLPACVSSRSPRPSRARPSTRSSHTSGPGVTVSGMVAEIGGGRRGRSRVAGCRRQTSRAAQRRRAQGRGAASGTARRHRRRGPARRPRTTPATARRRPRRRARTAPPAATSARGRPPSGGPRPRRPSRRRAGGRVAGTARHRGAG